VLIGEEVRALGREELDVTDASSVRTAFEAIRPDVVIHAAALTDTNACEHDPARARLVNGEGAGIVAEECSSSGSTMVYISSNEVFDGNATELYTEDASASPLNSYGHSKLEGERIVADRLGRYCIVRTSWLYGRGRINFPEKVLHVADAGELRVVTDEIASPTYSADLAAAISKLIHNEPEGIYHLTNAGYCSRLEWARAVLDLAGRGEIEPQPVTQAEFGAVYRKPVFSALANQRAASAGITLRHWKEALVDAMSGAGVAGASRSSPGNR
jgi:dTDP-4-dehydrorhamnose reductase